MSEVFGRIDLGDETIDLNNDNTQVYTHLGYLAVYNHVFVLIDKEKHVGCFIWAQQPPDNPNYTKVAQAALDHDCQAYLNMKEATDGDIAQFEKSASSDLDGGIPDDWK